MLRTLTLSLLLLSSAAYAQTPPPAVKQACAADAARLCPNTKGHETMVCMRSHMNEASDDCRAAVAARRAAMKADHAQGQAPPPAGDTGPH